MRAAVLLSLLVVLAACLGRGDPPEPTPEPLRFEFGAPVRLPAPGADPHGSEPSILAARDGSLYVVSVLGSVPPLSASDPAGYAEDRRGDALWKSTDAGATWRFLGKPDYPFGGGDADLDEDEGGTLYLPGQWRAAAVPPTPLPPEVDGELHPYVAGESMAVNANGGEGDWEVFPLASDSYYTDRQWTATYGRGTAWLAFNQLAQGLMVTKSTDAGRTWSTFKFVRGTGDGPNGPNGIPGDILADPRDGRLYLPYGPGIGAGSRQHRVFVSSDGGATFTPRVVHVAPEGEVAGAIFGSLDLDTEGNLYYAWSESEDGRKGMAVWLSTSDDRGESWSDPVRVSADTTTAVFPWVAAGAPGKVAVAYYAAEGRFLSDAAPAEAKWYPVVALTHGALDYSFGFERVPLQPEDDPNHVGPLCTQGTGCSGGTRDLGDFFEIDVAPDGSVVAAWVDDTEPARANLFARQTLGFLR